MITSRATWRRNAFSLVELLVVIAIIALLVALLFPALGHCRRLAKQSREAAAGAQLMTAFNLYANENRGNVLPAYVPQGMVDGSAGAIRVYDDSGNPVVDQLARRYPWRIAPTLDYNMRGLYDDPAIFEKYQSLTDRQYAISVSPSYGINADFMGGKSSPGLGFNPNALRAFGQFYVTRLDQIRRADRLICFASARGVDAFTGSPTATGVVPGFHMVNSPWFQASRWSAEAPTADSNPEDHGYVDPRHSGKANIAHADGHIGTLAIDDLRDMTRWSNQATRADWTLGSN